MTYVLVDIPVDILVGVLVDIPVEIPVDVLVDILVDVLAGDAFIAGDYRANHYHETSRCIPCWVRDATNLMTLGNLLRDGVERIIIMGLPERIASILS